LSQFGHRAETRNFTKRSNMQHLEIVTYLPLAILVLGAAKGGSLTIIQNIKIGSFRKRRAPTTVLSCKRKHRSRRA
jgi:hypothetical protein